MLLPSTPEPRCGMPRDGGPLWRPPMLGGPADEPSDMPLPKRWRGSGPGSEPEEWKGPEPVPLLEAEPGCLGSAWGSAPGNAAAAPGGMKALPRCKSPAPLPGMPGRGMRDSPGPGGRPIMGGGGRPEGGGGSGRPEGGGGSGWPVTAPSPSPSPPSGTVPLSTSPGACQLGRGMRDGGGGGGSCPAGRCALPFSDGVPTWAAASASGLETAPDECTDLMGEPALPGGGGSFRGCRPAAQETWRGRANRKAHVSSQQEKPSTAVQRKSCPSCDHTTVRSKPANSKQPSAQLTRWGPCRGWGRDGP